ncbi:hypothetical protein QBC37DRAFT_408664 [Rhypophila decipiens]|uniref:Uncharacterized protein n=1 Tax=Rhypophila decipiens TaxID=261697 RepID=A0AAN6YNC0_9PEZI|nr:hypothetical protein QBC37DRAFT_408664 [Rhypophila decipiens]
MSRFLEDTRNKTMTSIRSSFPNGAPTAVVVEGSPPSPPPPPTSQLQPHSQLLSTPLAVQDSIPAGAHNNPGINTTTNDSEQARQNRLDDDDDDDDSTVSNNQSRAESPPQVVPTPKTTTKSHIKRPAVQQQAAEPTSSISSSSTKHSPKDVTTTTTKPIPESDIHTRRPSPSRHPKAPTTRLNAHQIFYIFILDGLGAMILSGAINFAIAYAMYTSSSPAAAGTTTNSVVPPPTTTIILLFHLPNSLAGDAAVTIVLQTVITWLVEFLLVNRDLERGGVRPVGFVGIPRHGKFVRWFCFLDDGDVLLHQDLDSSSSKKGNNNSKTVMESEEREESTTRLKLPNFWGAGWVSIIWSQIVRALVVAVVMFLLLWGPCVGILMALGRKDETIGALGDWVFEQRVWLPQVFKLILGALLALLETPAFAFFWMVQAGWDFQKLESSTGTRAGGAGVVGERGSVTEKEGV